MLKRTLGADGHAITLASPLVPEVVLHYTSWKQITGDVDDARVYGGVHYRFDQEEAAEQGHRVGTYVLLRWLRAVHRHNAADTPSTSSCGPPLTVGRRTIRKEIQWVSSQPSATSR